MTREERIEAEVQALERLDLEGLRAEWRRRGYGPTPKLRSVSFLRYAIAWRIQAKAFGGLTAATRRRLRSAKAVGQSDNLHQGLVVTKTWRGREYRVERTPAGYVWNEQTFKSLSAAAFAITGVKHNGPRFFGLRDEAA